MTLTSVRGIASVMAGVGLGWRVEATAGGVREGNGAIDDGISVRVALALGLVLLAGGLAEMAVVSTAAGFVGVFTTGAVAVPAAHALTKYPSQRMMIGAFRMKVLRVFQVGAGFLRCSL
jgi:hypothetical protein